MESFITAGLGVLCGGIITIVVAHVYYTTASRDLKKEASDLRKLTILMLRALEQGGLPKFTKDEEGLFKGLLDELKSKIVVKSKTSDAELTVKDKGEKS